MREIGIQNNVNAKRPDSRNKDLIWVILIITILTLPLFIYGESKMYVGDESNEKVGKSGEILTFNISFERTGGLLITYYEIRNIRNDKGWNYSFSETLIKIYPNSNEKVIIKIFIPLNTKDGEENMIRFDFVKKAFLNYGEERFHAKKYWIHVNNTQYSRSLRDGNRSEEGTNWGFSLSIYWMIPICTIIICVIILNKHYR